MNKGLVKYVIMVLLLVGTFGADFLSKRWAQENLRGKPATVAIQGVLDFGYAENRGMVFGILNDRMPGVAHKALVGTRILILALLTFFVFAARDRKFVYLLPFLLFWAGAVGNLIDPFIYGYVVDFIHLHLWTILDWPFLFNLADAYVTVGIIIMLMYSLLGKKVIPELVDDKRGVVSDSAEN